MKKILFYNAFYLWFFFITTISPVESAQSFTINDFKVPGSHPEVCAANTTTCKDFFRKSGNTTSPNNHEGDYYVLRGSSTTYFWQKDYCFIIEHDPTTTTNASPATNIDPSSKITPTAMIQWKENDPAAKKGIESFLNSMLPTGTKTVTIGERSTTIKINPCNFGYDLVTTTDPNCTNSYATAGNLNDYCFNNYCQSVKPSASSSPGTYNFGPTQVDPPITVTKTHHCMWEKIFDLSNHISSCPCNLGCTHPEEDHSCDITCNCTWIVGTAGTISSGGSTGGMPGYNPGPGTGGSGTGSGGTNPGSGSGSPNRGSRPRN